MATFLPGVPEAGEYNPAFANYIQLAARIEDPADTLRRQWEHIAAALRELPPEKRLYRYAPGKWSVTEMVGHLIDTERVFACRALCTARRDPVKLSPFEENDYVVAAESERCDWDELVEEFEHVRKGTALFFRHLPPEAWMRRSVVGGTSTTVRTWAYATLGHAAHHLTILKERYSGSC